MLLTESPYLFSISFLQQLSRELNQPQFTPNDTQTLVLEHALRVLDLELSRQAEQYPDLFVSLKQLLESKAA